MSLGLLFTACGRDVPNGGGAGSDLALFIEPPSLDLYRDQPFTFDVILSDESAPKSVLGSPELTLELGKADIAQVMGNGTGVARGPGQTALIAAYLGFEGEASIKVHAGRLVGIEVVPAFVRLRLGETTQVRVTGNLDDGDQLDLTRGYQGTAYTSSNPNVASVSKDGLVLAVSEGTTIISITHGRFSGQMEIEVSRSQAVLTALVIEPEQASLEFFESVQLGVFGIDDAGNKIDLLADLANYPVSLSSSDPMIAGVDAKALVTAQRSSGSATILAQLDGLTAFAEIRVLPSESDLIDVLVEPSFAQIRVGENLQLRVTGIYLDGTLADLTPQSAGTSYASSDPGGFSVTANGLVTGQSAGRGGVVTVLHGLFQRFASINVVGEKELIGIEVWPSRIDLGVGGFVQLQVLALYGDGSVVDVTFAQSGVLYLPPAEGIVGISPDGFVQAIFPGGGFTIVDYLGFQAFVPTTVLDPSEIIGISFFPTFVSLPEGSTRFVQVIASLTDGSVIDITFDPALSVTVDAPRTAGYLGGGIVEGRQAGFTTLRATYLNFFAQADVEVTGIATLVGLELSIPAEILLGTSVPYSVIALYSDGSNQDVTFHPQTSVQSFDPTVLDVFAGLATGLSVGTVQVLAEHQGFQTVATVEVTEEGDPIVALSFQPPVLSIAVNGTGLALLIAVHQSGLIEDVSSAPGVFYTPSGPIGATVTPNGLQVGGFVVGTGEVIATYQGLNARLQVNVGMTTMVVGIEIVARAQIDLGDSDTFFVIAFFSDGSFTDVTFDPALSLISSNPMVLSVALASMTGVSPGTADIIATYQGLSDIHSVIVGMDSVIALEFVPPSITMDLGVQARAQVIATFASGVQANVTFDPNLSANVTGPISISPGAGGNILIDATGPGMASIIATYEGFSATLPITIVTNRTLVGITLVAPSQLDLGASDFYQVIANFSDGSVDNVTFDPGLMVSSSPPGVVAAGFGLVNGLAVGQANVTASYQGFSDTVAIEVTDEDPIIAIGWNPPQLSLQIGGSATAQLIAISASGNTVDITADPGSSFSTTGPITIGPPGPGGLQITGNAQGNGQVTATFMGFVAGLPVTVGNAATLVSIRIEPASVQVAEGDSIQLAVIGVFSDGTEMPIIGAAFINFDPNIADLSPTGLVTGLSSGTGGGLVTFGNFAEFIQIDVFSAMGPTITSIAPTAILVGSPATLLTVNGSGFSNGDAIFVDGFQINTTFGSAGQLSGSIPSFLLGFADTLDIQVRGANGRSNIVALLVGELPNVVSWSPDSVLRGSTVDVTIVGSGLSDLALSASGGLDVVEIAAAPDGTWVRVRVTASANDTLGTQTVTLSNTLGMDSIQIEVLATTGLMDLIVATGQTVTLSGTNVFANVTVQTGGRIVGGGLDTLAIIASNSITIRGTIDVSGRAGDPGFTTPSPGGAAGPGGAGGGGGGDGNAMTPASGGAGSPPGFEASIGFGSGTPGGDGGGEGGGGAGAFGCGHGGGGGALGGDGGSGGGDFGVGSGGFGGASGGRGSNFGDGTGGGGGSTCGNASGGGGGGGGGGLILQVAPNGTILIDGAIRAVGGDGGDGFQNTGAGGGGSGGRVEIIAPSGSITVNDTISARGGNGGDTDFGDTGGGGGGGIILIDAAGGTANVGLGLLDVDGGVEGASLGGGFEGIGGTAGMATTTP